MSDCNCPPPPPVPVTPVPSGNTQTQTTLSGSRYPVKGQPKATFANMTPGGALMVANNSTGFTGGWNVQAGDQAYFKNGVLQYVLRGGVAINPVGGGLDGHLLPTRPR